MYDVIRATDSYVNSDTLTESETAKAIDDKNCVEMKEKEHAKSSENIGNGGSNYSSGYDIRTSGTQENVYIEWTNHKLRDY